MAPTLIITNDFPPTIGGIEAFVAEITQLLNGDVIVLTRRTPGWADHDQELPFPVVRQGSLLLPTPAVARTAAKLIKENRVDSVIFGAMAPLALLGPGLRDAGAQRLLAISHGHETWWAGLPVSRQLLRRMADGVDQVSVISDYTRSRIAPALSSESRSKLIKLPPPVDLDRFHPDVDDGVVDHEGDRRLRCIAVGRLVRQKGFEDLLRCWPAVLDQLNPSARRKAELVLVGDGPRAGALRRTADRLRISDSIRFTGALDRDAVAGELRRATVFALPVRTRLLGLNPEGLGLGFLEAAASGLPVIVGRSGGAPETVCEGRTGFVVDPGDRTALAARIAELLGDPDRAAEMGRAGREFVGRTYGTARAAAVLRAAE
jgi:phosphatidylinositol alpha-1,6-mannosyltransferase